MPPGIAIAFEDGPERGRHGHAAFGIDLVGEGGDKAIHPLRSSLAATLRHRQIPIIRRAIMGLHGI